jgi:hypothetical protein
MALYDPITIARFWSKVDVKKSELVCWEWRGASSRNNYGRIKIGGVSMTASRVAWEMYNGAPLGERFALHTCDNPKCCNPKHLFAGTNTDNMDDMMTKGRGKNFRGAGEKNPNAVLTEDQVAVIKARIISGDRNRDIAKDYPVSEFAISSIKHGGNWSHVAPATTPPRNL